MSANAGLVINTPTLIPISVVIANPFNNPAPTHKRGIRETKVVKYAPRIIAKARFTLCFKVREVPCCRDSSITTITSSTPVPIDVKIPAILGKSMFHPMKDATPKVTTISEIVFTNNAAEDLNLLYLKKIINATAITATSAARKIESRNSFPKRGEIVSNLTISNL